MWRIGKRSVWATLCVGSSSANSADDAVDLNIEDDDCVLYGDAQNPLPFVNSNNNNNNNNNTMA